MPGRSRLYGSRTLDSTHARGPASQPMNDDVWLQVSGPHLTTRAGRRVVLRGVGLGAG
jgi:hypothetical protein